MTDKTVSAAKFARQPAQWYAEAVMGETIVIKNDNHPLHVFELKARRKGEKKDD